MRRRPCGRPSGGVGSMRHARERGDPRKFRAHGFVGWWRADLGITLNGSNVSAWADQSGSANHLLQGTAASQPLFVSAGPNGLPTIRGDGTDDTMVALFAHDPPITRFAAWKSVTLGTSGVSDCILAGGAGNKVLLINNTAPQVQMFNGAFLGPASSINTAAYGHTTEKFNGASSELRNNMSSLATGDAGAGVTLAGASLFQNGGSGRFSNTELAEMVIYLAAMAPSPIARIERYLKARYAL